MELLVLGFSHKTDPIDRREGLCVPTPRLGEFLKEIRSLSDVSGVVYLQTCNRVELYLAFNKRADTKPALNCWRNFLSMPDEIIPSYSLRGEEAFGHLLKVASGLEAMAVGESQILGQVKEAYHLALKLGVSGGLLNYAFQRALYFAKRVRTETGIARYPVSMMGIACTLLEKIYGDLQHRTGLILGTGAIGEKTAQFLREREVQKLYLSNRTQEKALALAKNLGASAVAIPFSSFCEVFSEIDFIVSATTSAEPILTQQTLTRHLLPRRKGPLVLIDLGVPRDIDPSIAELDNVYLYNVDDLQGIAFQNQETRASEMELAYAFIQNAIDSFSLEWTKRVEISGRVAHLVRVLP